VEPRHVEANLGLLEPPSGASVGLSREISRSPAASERERAAVPAGLGAVPATLHRSPNGTAIAAEGVPPTLVERLLADPEAVIRRGLKRPVKISHGSVLVEAELPLGGRMTRVAYKQYRPRSRWKAICHLLRRSPARRDWTAAQRLVALGIATARPVLLVEPAAPRLRRRSYLATEWIAGSLNLHLWGWELAELPLNDRLERAARCAEGLGRLIGRLHGCGVAHRDLKGANLLVVDRGGRIATWLVDVAGARFVRRLSDRRRARNLARLAVGLEAHPWVGRTACCRFLRAYLRELLAPKPDWKTLWRDVAAESRRLRAKMLRRGEPLL